MSNCGSWVYGAVSAAERTSRSFDPKLEPLSDNRPDDGQALTGLDLAKIIEGLKRRFAWYGFRPIVLGPFIKIKDDTISIDLFVRDFMLGHVEVDRYSGAITRWLVSKSVRNLLFSDAGSNARQWD
jgi:hypothetical protein